MADSDGARTGADSRGHTRRAILAASAAGAGAGIASALSSSGNPGNLWGGTMALTEAFNVSGDLWIGPDSAKSNVDATDGRVYMASDTQVEYYGDGGAWTKLGVGSSAEPVPSVHTDDAYNGDNPITARVYNDAGTYRANGRDQELGKGSDVGAVIQAAVDAVVDADSMGTGQAIAIARGHHADAASTVNLDDGAALQGEGMRATVLEPVNAFDANLIEYLADDSTSDRDFFAGLRDLKLNGNKANNVSGHGVYTDSPNSEEPNDWHMNRVFVHNFAGTGLKFNFSWGYHIHQCLVETCDGDGIELAVGQQNYLSNSFAAYNGRHGIYCKTDRTPIVNVEVRENGNHGLFTNAGRVRLANIHAHRNGRHGLNLNGNGILATNITAQGNDQNGGGYGGLQLPGTDVFVTAVYANDGQTTATQTNGLDINGTRVRGNLIFASGNTDNGIIVRSTASDVYLSGVTARNNGSYGLIAYAPGTVIENFQGSGNGIDDLRIEANDCVIRNSSWGSLTDNGDRTILNGRSYTSAASPGAGTSVWDGNEARAYDYDVTVEDRSVTAPYPQYKADSAGNWVQVG